MPYPQFIKLTDQEIRTMISDLEVAIFEDQNYLDQLSSDLVIITAKWIDLKNPEMVNENEETAKKLLDQIGALEWNIDTQIETLDGLAWQLKDLKWELLERTENLEKATTGEDDKDEGGEGIGEEA